MNPRENRLRISRLQARDSAGGRSGYNKLGTPQGTMAERAEAKKPRKTAPPSGRRALIHYHSRHGTRRFDVT